MTQKKITIPDNTNVVIKKIKDRWMLTNSMAGVGLDPNLDKFPQYIWQNVDRGETARAITFFNKRLIDATAPYVVDYKINSNFYQGIQGRKALAQTFSYLRSHYPDIVRIYDGKFADVGHTAEFMAEEIFGNIDADAVLLNPYLGFDAIKPFTEWKDKLVVLCINTSNQSAGEIQNVVLKNGMKLWEYILRLSVGEWNENGNIIPVLSATYPNNLIGIRDIVGELPILLAGIGQQGGDLKQGLKNCLDNDGYGVLISSSREILYPKDRSDEENFTDASKKAIIDLKNRINKVKDKEFNTSL